MAGSIGQPDLREIVFQVPPEAEEPVAAVLEACLGQPPVVWLDRQRGRCSLKLYRPWDQPLSAEERARLRQGLDRLRRERLLPSLPRWWSRRLPGRAWTESWKRHFRPRLFVGRVLVRPSWSRRRPRPGQVEVVLDPGLSFGTGHHPTTAFCLEQLIRAVDRSGGKRLSFLDVGTGSGLLAIAAVRLGCGPVEAFDFDPEAVRVAAANARANGVELRLRRADARRLSVRPRRRFDLVAANLQADLLLEIPGRLKAQVKPGGRLMVAGILREEFPGIQAAYEAGGWRLVGRRSEKEWTSGVFESPSAGSA